MLVNTNFMRVLLARVSVLLSVLLPSAGYSQTDSSVDSNPKVQQRLQELEAMKGDLLRKMQDLDNRIHTLEAEVKRQKSETAKIAAKAAAPPQQPSPPVERDAGRKSSRRSGQPPPSAVGEPPAKRSCRPGGSLTNFKVGTSISKFSGRPRWTPFTTRRVPRRPAFRSFWFRSLPADFRSTPWISTLGIRR